MTRYGARYLPSQGVDKFILPISKTINFLLPLTPQMVEYLIVGGGGEGGNGTTPTTWENGGGGGAGGFREGVTEVFTQSLYIVSVGAGGSTGTGGTSAPGTGSASGSPSSVFDVESAGGGRGGMRDHLRSAGGSGGGAASYSNTGTNILTGASGNTPEVSPSQGNDGGSGSATSGGNGGAGGGGGAGGAGGSGSGNIAGSGGLGKSSEITGASILYAAGGGGAGGTAGSGGSGIGGAGGNATTTAGTNGVINTGSGGGGSYSGFDVSGGSGGSGVVIIRYPSSFRNLLIGSGLQYRDNTGATVNGTGVRVAPSYTPTGFKVYQFNGGTGNIEF